ncbi:DNA repair protein RecO [Clostridiaceae bacterium M8S5]|nr:DNA repair protein RecO [Clostridiaceae bacterium M8S5]
MLLKLEGVVLKETKYSESDKILTIFTKENGKIQGIAKGARKQKNKLFSSTQLLTVSNFVVYRGRNMHTINQGDMIKTYSSVREDLDRLTYAMYVLQLVDASVPINEQNIKVYNLLLKTLEVLSKTTEGYIKIILAFELKHMSFIGYKPNTKRCCECGKEVIGEAVFSSKSGGVLCDVCKSYNSYDFMLDKNLAEGLRLLMYSRLDELDKIKLDYGELKELQKLTRKYIEYYVDKKDFNALKFLDFIS